jgi:hypothetical protein
MSDVLLCSTSSGIHSLFRNIKNKVINIDFTKNLNITCLGNSIYLIFLYCLSIKPEVIEFLLKEYNSTLERVSPYSSVTDPSKKAVLDDLKENLTKIISEYGLGIDENILLKDFCLEKGYNINIPTFIKNGKNNEYYIVNKENYNGKLVDAIIIGLICPGFLSEYSVLDKVYTNHLSISILNEYTKKYDIKVLENIKLSYNEAKEDTNFLFKKEVFFAKDYSLLINFLKEKYNDITFYETKINKNK